MYFISLFVDWIFQTSWQASNKSKWGISDNKKESFLAVVSHSLTYAILTTLIVFLTLDQSKGFLISFCVLFVTHTIIDTRIPVKGIMRFKGMSKEQIDDIQNFGFMHIGIDHRLHEVVLLILSYFI